MVLLRYILLLVLFKSEGQIANSCRARLTTKAAKSLSHTALVVNNLPPQFGPHGDGSLIRLANVVSWLMLTQHTNQRAAQKAFVTVYDQGGKLETQAELFATLIQQNLGQRTKTNCGHSVVLTKAAISTCARCKQIIPRCSNQLVRKLAEEEMEDGPFTRIDVQPDDHNSELVPTRVIFRRAQSFPSGQSPSASLPQLALVFNSNKRILKLDGFPALLKENCEIVECGRLFEFSVVHFVRAIETFGSIEQRWGA